MTTRLRWSMRWALSLALAAGVTAAGVACSTSDDSSDAPGGDSAHACTYARSLIPTDDAAGYTSVEAGAPCTTAADCVGSDVVCGYAIAAGCSATGVCVPWISNGVLLEEAVCGCDGGLASVPGDFPGGYARTPVASSP